MDSKNNKDTKKTLKEVIGEKQQELQNKREEAKDNGVSKRPGLQVSQFKMLENYLLETTFNNVKNLKDNILSEQYGISKEVMKNVLVQISNNRELKTVISKVIRESLKLNRVSIIDRKGKNIKNAQRLMHTQLEKKNALLDKRMRDSKYRKLSSDVKKSDKVRRVVRKSQLERQKMFNKSSSNRLPLSGKVIRNKKNRDNENNE